MYVVNHSFSSNSRDVYRYEWDNACVTSPRLCFSVATFDPSRSRSQPCPKFIYKTSTL